MKLSPAKPGRTAILVVLLLATCYFADWTDDYLSYNVASSYAGESAGSVGGGSMPSTAMAAALVRQRSDAKASAIEAVFGNPLASQQPASASGSNSMSGFGLSDGSSDSDTASRASRSMSGASRGTGLGMGMASGLSGSGFSGLSN